MSFSIPKESDDPFQILGVSGDADETTIKRAYRRLAKRWHPDRNSHRPEAETRFREIQLAYEALKTRRGITGDGSRGRGGDADEYRAGPDPFGGFYWMLRHYWGKQI